MSIDTTWLRCPNCLLSLDAVGPRVLGCDNGHRFDVSKHETVTLLPPKAPRTIGDDREMLASRAALLDSGAYAPIASAVTDAVQARVGAADDATTRVADLGCGTGYYSAYLSRSIPGLEFLLGDRSPDAVRMSRRALEGGTGVVLDIWRPLPIRDAAADVVLNVFAPRNPPEFARILRPHGRVIVVVPTTAHLRELRATGAMLDVPAEKAELVGSRFADAGFSASSRATVEYDLEADEAMRAALVGMGPSAYHSTDRPADDAAPRRLTVSIDVLVFAAGPRAG